MRTCNATGISPYVNDTQSPGPSGPWRAPLGRPSCANTLYVVVEGNRFSSGVFGMPRTLNFQDDPVCIGTVELDGSPDLEPALTVDGVNDIDDVFNPGTPVTAYDQVLFGAIDPTQVRLIGAFDPADDLDGDGIQDLGDNCPFVINTAQSNRGSFLDDTDESDFAGDACQCAEATGDGAVTDVSMVPTPPPPYDLDEIRDFLSGRITGPQAVEIAARCSVVGTTECNIRDLVFLSKAIGNMDPSVDVRCDAALSPPNAP